MVHVQLAINQPEPDHEKDVVVIAVVLLFHTQAYRTKTPPTLPLTSNDFAHPSLVLPGD